MSQVGELVVGGWYRLWAERWTQGEVGPSEFIILSKPSINYVYSAHGSRPESRQLPGCLIEAWATAEPFPGVSGRGERLSRYSITDSETTPEILKGSDS